MPDTEKDTAFVPDDDLNNKIPKVEPAPEKQIGIDTENRFFDTMIEASFSDKLDMSALDSFLTTSRSRDQVYALLDEMGEDSTISAVLDAYAENATEINENGDIVWAESTDERIASYINYLLKAMRINKNIFGWVHALCQYGDVYIRLYRESEYEDDRLFEDTKPKRKLNEDIHLYDPDIDPTMDELDGREELTESVKIKAYDKDDHYVHYVEMVPNPAEMFELTKFGKTYAYIKSEINSPMAGNRDWFQGSEFIRYKFNRNDIKVYQPTEFVHACLENTSNRIPEEVSITFDNDPDADSDTSTYRYKVRRGQSLLYNVFKIWRMLQLLENAILLNRLTKSAIVRLFSVEVGDMPKENVGPLLQSIKSLMEQKSALNTNKSMNEYTNPGPIENNVYVPTHEGVGNITMQTVGGDVNVGELTDLDYFRRKLFAALRVPCLRGSTKILLLDGSTHTIEEMFNNQEKYIGKGILGCDVDGTLVPTTITNITLTKQHASFLRVHLDNGEFVDVTPNHLMMLRNGDFVRADNLSVGDSLMPYYDTYSTGCVQEDDHRVVVDIEYLGVDEPAYDIGVAADCHTFALPCGIFVHNCQYFGFTDDNAGFSGGQSLSIISSQFAKLVIRIQNTMIQSITDMVNLMLIDHGLSGYIQKFTIKMRKPITQDDIDKRDNMTGNLQVVDSIMSLLSDTIEDNATKLKILKSLLTPYLANPEVLGYIQQVIDDLEQQKEEEAAATSTEEGEETDLLGGEETGEESSLASDLGLSPLGGGGEETGEETPTETGTEEPAGGEEEALPTPNELGLDFTNSDLDEFQ